MFARFLNIGEQPFDGRDPEADQVSGDVKEHLARPKRGRLGLMFSERHLISPAGLDNRRMAEGPAGAKPLSAGGAGGVM